jgi:hypothetical protein
MTEKLWEALRAYERSGGGRDWPSYAPDIPRQEETANAQTGYGQSGLAKNGFLRNPPRLARLDRRPSSLVANYCPMSEAVQIFCAHTMRFLSAPSTSCFVDDEILDGGCLTSPLETGAGIPTSILMTGEDLLAANARGTAPAQHSQEGAHRLCGALLLAMGRAQ